MLDIHACLRQILLGNSTISSLTGGKVAWPDLPAGFDAKLGHKALTFFVRGGPINPELSAVVEPSIQVKAWALKPVDAMAIFSAAFDLLDGALDVGNSSGTILSAYAEQPGQAMMDPDTGWAVVLGYFKLIMVDTAGSSPSVIPGLIASGRHFAVEGQPNGIRTTFTFVGLPLDANKYAVVLNGIIQSCGFTQSGEQITFDDPPPAMDPLLDPWPLYAFY
jgi:hypothetical protein